MIGDYKLVDYHKYCATCKHEYPLQSDICNECLYAPAVVDSHKPINYEKKEERNARSVNVQRVH